MMVKRKEFIEELITDVRNYPELKSELYDLYNNKILETNTNRYTFELSNKKVIIYDDVYYEMGFIELSKEEFKKLVLLVL